MGSKVSYSLIDTLGEKWLVVRDDPAYPLVDYLDKQGWMGEGEEGVILPPSALITGRISQSQIDELREDLEGCLAALAAFPSKESDKGVLNAHAAFKQALAAQGGTSGPISPE